MKQSNILILEKYEKESSKLKMLDGRPLKNGAWTINLENTNIDTIHTIIYKTNKYIYQISRGDALKNGVLRIFGGERKLVVPLEFWEKLKND